MSYTPDYTASHEGDYEWGEDKSGRRVATRWVQHHDDLVQGALWSWKGAPSDMGIHLSDERQNAPQPSSGSGKQMRAQAGALLHELNNNARENDKHLYRGSHRAPHGIEAWSENRRTAAHWGSKDAGGQVYTLPKGSARGLKIRDYIRSGLDEHEREWLVDTTNVSL